MEIVDPVARGITVAQHEGIAAGTTGQYVSASVADQDVGAGATIQTVVAQAALQQVIVAAASQECDQCRKGEEQLCREGNTLTYGSPDRITKEMTYGGYSKHVVVRQEFVLRVPEGLDLARAAPLLCAGITATSTSCPPRPSFWDGGA
jgi:threonine dehydrogenase-like Zn-dependent dehydrogenase